MSTLQPQDEIKRQLAAQILEDERLTDELDDNDADMLINWGLAQAETIAAAPDHTDETRQREIKRIRKAMTLINRLVGQRAYLSADELNYRLSHLAELAKPGNTLQQAEKTGSVDIPKPLLSAAELTDMRLGSRELMHKLFEKLGKAMPKPEALPQKLSPKQEEPSADDQT